MINVIDSFSGDYFFLSNFYPSEIVVGNSVFATAEHLFQSFKCKNNADKAQFSKDYRLTAGQAKRAGRSVALRDDWELNKDDFMRTTLLLKFSPGSELSKMLIKTGNSTLIEGNTWKDTYWGVCDGMGHNNLGRILMEIRFDLNAGK